uniref:Uncharacterized protein n=1 Tax=Melopsittacus undulatus TaxID=13146 RepID=A0A8V5H4C9_MELUD
GRPVLIMAGMNVGKGANINNTKTMYIHAVLLEINTCLVCYQSGSSSDGKGFPHCSHTVDTKCSPCRPNTYTAIWNLSPQCFACSPPCKKGFVQNQACTTSQDRICSCPPNEYCILKIYEYCIICKAHKKCGKGYRVSRRGNLILELFYYMKRVIFLC